MRVSGKLVLFFATGKINNIIYEGLNYPFLKGGETRLQFKLTELHLLLSVSKIR